MNQKKRSYAIIGAGAVGGYYGAKLQKAGFEVHYLVQSSFESIKKNGLFIQTKDLKFHLSNINIYNDATAMPACDVVIISLKTTQNKHLAKLLTPLLKSNSVILTMQNGLGNEELLETIAPNHPILCATTLIGAMKASPEKIQIKHGGSIKLAEYSTKPQITNLVKMIAEDFKHSEIPTELFEDYLLIRWQKLLWNIPFNGLSVIENTTVDLLLKNKMELIITLSKEVIRIAKAYQREISDEFLEKLIAFTTTLTGYETSMKVDYKNAKPLEIEYLYSNPLAAAAVKNIQCPAIQNLYYQLKQLPFCDPK